MLDGAMSDDQTSQLDRVARETGLEASLEHIDELKRELAASRALVETQARAIAAAHAMQETLTRDLSAVAAKVRALEDARTQLSGDVHTAREELFRLRHELSLSLPRFVYRRLRGKKPGS